MLGQGALNSQPLNSLPAPLGLPVKVADSQLWRLRVLVGGLDLSDRLTGPCSVEAEENGSRLCTLHLLPEPGLFEADQWTGRPVQLWQQRLEGDQLAAETLWFTGYALQPRWNISTQVIRLTATCQRQRRLADLSPAQVAALIPGDYADGIFGPVNDSERFAADLLSTRPVALDCGADGQFRLTPWAAKASPDYHLTADEVIDGSLELTLATADQLLNQLVLHLEYRYSRLRYRRYQFNWAHPAGNFCTWLADSTDLVTLSMLNSALEQSNWQLHSLSYEALPPSMSNPCGNVGFWINRYTADPHLLAFSASVGSRIAQSLSETYHLTLGASGSQATYGLRSQEERFGDEVVFDAGEWESDEGGPAEGAVQDELGDWIADQSAPARRSRVLHTALAVGETRLLAQHRLNRLRLQLPQGDTVFDLRHTLQVEALGIRAKGKVARLNARWDHDSGSANLELELAISRSGPHVPAGPLSLPSPPVFDLGSPPTGSSELVTQLGGRPGSPPFDENLDGVSANYGVLFPGAETYPRRLQISTPEIAAAHRDPVSAERLASYEITIPNDLLLMEVQ